MEDALKTGGLTEARRITAAFSTPCFVIRPQRQALHQSPFTPPKPHRAPP